MIDQAEQRLPIPGDVDEDHRFVVQPSLRQVMISKVSSRVPKPPGSTAKASDISNMRCLALMHAVDDDQLAGAAMANLDLVQMVRDDADHIAAAGERGIGERAHQPDAGAAIDEADSPCGHGAAQFAGGLRMAAIDANPAGAIDAKGRVEAHSIDFQSVRGIKGGWLLSN